MRILTARTCRTSTRPRPRPCRLPASSEDLPDANLGMVIEVLDEEGQMVLTVPFTEAVDPLSRRPSGVRQ
jgi:hypothetical protein